MRFATRGPSLVCFRGRACRRRDFPAHRRARFLKTQTSYEEDAMTKRSEAKYKIDRRMGQNIWGRPKSPVNRREYGPGQHGQRRKGKLSDFGVQLRAKQKLKGYYANISSYKLKVGDVVEVKESSKQLTPVLEAVQLGERDVPDFLEVDHSKMT